MGGGTKQKLSFDWKLNPQTVLKFVSNISVLHEKLGFAEKLHFSWKIWLKFNKPDF